MQRHDGLEFRAGQEDGPPGARDHQVPAQLGEFRRKRVRTNRSLRRERALPTALLEQQQRTFHLDLRPQDGAGVDREPGGLVERSGRELEQERRIGLARVCEVPLPAPQHVDAPQLQPGVPVVGRHREVATQHVGGHAPLALANQLGGTHRHARIHRPLRHQREGPGCEAGKCDWKCHKS